MSGLLKRMRYHVPLDPRMTTLASRSTLTEAASAGYYRSPGWGRDYPRIQILTIAELLGGAQIQMPPTEAGTFKQAQRVEQRLGEQPRLDL